jgi:hypothetical protein
MILRRLTTALRKQDWFTVLVEIMIVVLGVFIGIQVSNWNAARLDRAIERDTLIRLHADIEASIAGQDRDLRFLGQQIADQKVVLAALDACAVTPEDESSFQRGLVTLGYVNPPRLYRRTIDEIAASGRTDIIRNETIADELAGIVARVEWRTAGHAQIIDGFEPHRRRLEQHIRYTLEQSFEDAFIPNLKGGIVYDIKALCGDAGAANGVSAVSYQTLERLEAYRPILQSYRVFLPLLEAELRDRWGTEMREISAP